MPGFRSSLTALLLAASALGGARAASAATVLLADGRTLTGVELKAGPSPAQVEITGGAAGSLTVGKDEILVVDFGSSPGKPQPPSMRLANGVQFSVGKISFPGGRR